MKFIVFHAIQKECFHSRIEIEKCKQNAAVGNEKPYNKKCLRLQTERESIGQEKKGSDIRARKGRRLFIGERERKSGSEREVKQGVLSKQINTYISICRFLNAQIFSTEKQ